jgi:hypothetical protein
LLLAGVRVLKLPLEYRWLKFHGFNGFRPWHLIEDPGSKSLRLEYQVETGKDFYPFAHRQDCDEFAGFVVVDNEIQRAVVVVHLTWSRSREVEGFPTCKEFKSMFHWLKEVVIVDTYEWMSEEELESLEEDQDA